MILLSFNEAFDYVIKNETQSDNIDEVSDNPNDPGGLTKYGISLRFLKSLHAVPEISELIDEDSIKNLTLEEAKAIYYANFWQHAPFDKINVDSIRNYIFDMAVNMGIAPAIKCAQRACWAEREYGFLTDDGIMGSNTIYVINHIGSLLIYPLKAERANYYRMIVERNPSQSVFLEGWLNRTYRN